MFGEMHCNVPTNFISFLQKVILRPKGSTHSVLAQICLDVDKDYRFDLQRSLALATTPKRDDRLIVNLWVYVKQRKCLYLLCVCAQIATVFVRSVVVV